MGQEQSELPPSAPKSPLPALVANALREAFAEQPVENFAPFQSGMSGASVFLVTVAGAEYVIKTLDIARPGHQELAEREFACATIAGEHGVGPKVHYADADSGICISERIAATAAGRSPANIVRMANTLRRLHTGPAFPMRAKPLELLHYIDGMISDRWGEGLPGELIQGIGAITDATARFANTAPCHNDLNPSNIVTTADAFYFVDWATAGMADPFIDLAELGVFYFSRPEQRRTLLEAYLERTPNDEEIARITVVRALALGIYAAGFAFVAYSAGIPNAFAATPLAIPEMLAMLRDASGRMRPDIVAASLFAAMRQETATLEFEAAMRRLQAGE